MAELKTRVNNASVSKFIKSIADPRRRKDAEKIIELMEQASGEPPRMWGKSIVGFGTYHYKYASGREGDWFTVGFSPRKQNLTLYLIQGFEGKEALLRKLGKYTSGVGCLYIKKLDDVNLPTLQKLIARSVQAARETNQA